MKCYLDSSVLVKLYVTEEFSLAARTLVQGLPQLPITWLHGLEVSNALRLLTGRGLLTMEESKRLLEQWEEDRRERRLVDSPLDWPKVFQESMRLSQTHSARLLTRSLDILHVAAAVELGCERFVSADERQLKLAKATGLKMIDIRRG